MKIRIDGKEIGAEEGETILNAAVRAGIEIPNLCYLKELSPYGACGLCVVEVEGCPKLLRACATVVKEGMSVNTKGDRALRARKLAMELLMGDHDADCLGPCRLECPAHTDCQKYVKEISEGRFADATATVMETFPLPASIGRVCPHPCEKRCRRGKVEEPVSIAALKYFAADECASRGLRSAVPAIRASTGRVTVVGGGPAGLTAAYQLRRRGFEVTVYDRMPEMGGMLRYGIPEYRLPKAVLKRETDAIAAMGVKFVNDFRVGRDGTLEELRAGCDALLVANGAWKSTSLRVKGEELDGVVGGIDFLRERPDVKGLRVAVVGGGNTAMDACRTAVRLGASEVSVIYRRTRAEMPAEEIEIREAEEEGVVYRFLRNPDVIIGESGRVAGVRLQVMKLGEPDERGRRRPVAVEGEFEEMKLDLVIIAAGQKNDPEGFESLPVTERGTIAADPKTFWVADGIFACGDAVNRGAGIAIGAIAQANRAVAAIVAYLEGGEAALGKLATEPEPIVSKRSEDAGSALLAELAGKERLPRQGGRARPAAERRRDFGEVAIPLSAEEAIAEAKRCLECGCHDFSECRLIRYANQLGIDTERLRGEFHPGFIEDRLVSIERNQRKCITCNLCVRVCESEAKKGLLGLVGRGFTTVIKPEFRDPAVTAGCAACKKCVDACPTGALRFRRTATS